MISIDTTNMCSHLQKKLFEEDGVYHHIWMAMQDDDELTAVVFDHANCISTVMARKYWYWPAKLRRRLSEKTVFVR